MDTIIIIGPGGIGKGPLDALLKDDIVKLDPYRLRSNGPRDSSDTLYAHPKLRNELLTLLEEMGDKYSKIECSEEKIKWFPKARVLFFTVRKEWQLLMLKGIEGKIAKAEIYAPVLLSLLKTPEIRCLLGQLEIILLNPSTKSINEMDSWENIKEETKNNCIRRKDPEDTVDTVKKRVKSIDEEAPIWKELFKTEKVTEYCNWKYPEYLYTELPKDKSLVEHQKDTLKAAQKCLIKGNQNFESFFKSV
jgi:hypothetical protein